MITLFAENPPKQAIEKTQKVILMLPALSSFARYQVWFFLSALGKN